MAIRVGYQQQIHHLPLPRLVVGSSVFISAAAGREEAALMARLLSATIAERAHDLYTLSVNDVGVDGCCCILVGVSGSPDCFREVLRRNRV